MSLNPISLGPVGHASLAVFAAQVDALAEEIEFELSTKRRPYEPDPDFVPSARLTKLAARGLAVVVASRNTELAGLDEDACVARLERASVPRRVAAGVAAKFAARRILAVTSLSDAQRSGGVEALMHGSQLATEQI